jgi:hypothetical protein
MGTKRKFWSTTPNFVLVFLKAHDLIQVKTGQKKSLLNFATPIELFWPFANRLLNKSRPEYPEFIDWLNLDSATLDRSIRLPSSVVVAENESPTA